MIRATGATWLNYATTILFQILFAARYGATGEAGAFAIALAVAISVGGVFVTTAVTNVLPRMVGQGGRVTRPALSLLGGIAALVIVSATLIWAASAALAELIAPLIKVEADLMGALLRMSALFLGSLGLAGVFGSIALIRGHRFMPAFAPAFPSVLGALYLLAVEGATVDGTFGAVAIGGAIQVVAVGAAALLPTLAVVDGPPLRLARTAALTAALLLLIGFLPALQRTLAAATDPAGAAHFDYAARAMQIAQQLLVGGVVIAILPDWTTKFSAGRDIQADVVRMIGATLLLLFIAGAVALVAAPPLVALLLERGAFLSEDTDAVATLVRILVPGFISAGIWLVLGQAVLAIGRMDLVLRVWAVLFVSQLVLTALLGLGWGAVGVAAAYSASMLVVVTVGLIFAARLGLLQGGAPLLIRSLGAGIVTMVAAIALLLLGDPVPPLVATVMVLAVGLALALRLRLFDEVLDAIRGPRSKSMDAQG